MRIDKIQWAKLKLKWEIMKYGSIDVYIEEIISKTSDTYESDQYHSFANKDIIKERLVNIQKKIPLLLQQENYEELARLKKLYESLMKKYKGK